MGVRNFFATIVDLRQRFDEVHDTVAMTTVRVAVPIWQRERPAGQICCAALEFSCDGPGVEKRQRMMLQCNI